MNHKRGRPKNRRAGCLMCKPWKANHAKGEARQTLAERRLDDAVAPERNRTRNTVGPRPRSILRRCRDQVNARVQLVKDERGWFRFDPIMWDAAREWEKRMGMR